MLRKYATATVISAEIAERNAVGLVRTAHRAVFNYEPKPGFLYVRSRMISSRCNDNHDEFPAEEIRKAWKTAIGKPVFVNHRNEDHRRMRGVIIDAALHEDVLPDGKPDVWIEALHEIDAQRFPKLAKAILEGRVNRTSMGTDVGFSVCSACGNKASTPAEYCQHIPQMKGKILYRHTASGQREGHLIREICYKLGFFENSFLVEDPADPTAVVTGVDDRGLKTTASLTKEAAPEGMRFRFTRAEHHPNRKHFLKATLPDEEGRHREVGYLMWEPHDGQVSMVQTDYDKRGQGIASALWHRAHEVAGQHGLTPPRHSDVQTPDGMEWAQKVDQQPIHAPGPGQQSFFEPTPEQGGTEVAGVPRPAHDDLFDHLLHDHAEWGRADVERMRDRNSLESAHQRLHADPGMFPGRQFHIHGMRSSLPKLADYHIPCERPGCGMHWGPHGAAGLLIRHHDPEDGQTRYLLQKRAPWVDHGGTWGIPGGALHEDESPEEGAEREAEEEMGELPYNLRHHRTHTDDHGGWAYHTVVLDSPERFHPGGGGDHSYGDDDDDYHDDDDWGYGDGEATGHGWFTKAEMKNMDLHPGFAQSLKTVTSALSQGDAVQVFPRDGRWIVADASGTTLSAHDTRTQAERHRATLYRSQPDAGDRSGIRDPRSGADTPVEIVRARTAMRKGAPFAGYEDFEDCTEKNSDKESPDKYCGEIKKRTEGSHHEDVSGLRGGVRAGGRATGAEANSLPRVLEFAPVQAAHAGSSAEAHRAGELQGGGRQAEARGVRQARVLEVEAPGDRADGRSVRGMRRDESARAVGEPRGRQDGHRGQSHVAGVVPGGDRGGVGVRSALPELSAPLGLQQERSEAAGLGRVQASARADVKDAYCGEIKHRAEGSLQSSLPSIEIEAVRYDKPTDHPFFQDVPLHPQYIIDAYDESDAPTKAQGMRWYSDGYHVARALDPDGDAHRGAGVLAAYSPRSNWPINLFNASRSLQQRRAVRIGEGMNVMGNHAKAAAKILEDGKHYSEAFTTPKITDFAHLLAHGGDDQECETCAPHKKPDHPEQRVVVDRHALSAAAGRRMTDNDLGRAPLGTRKFYEHVADQYRTAAQHISDRDGVTVHPHQLQAITWLQQQKRNAVQEQGEAATDPKAKGRLTRERNAWTKWEEHSRQHHPEFHTGDEEANMHLRNPHAGMRSSLPSLQTSAAYFAPSSLPSVLAYGETRAPADVDTLRTESCPVCGETDAFDGDRCQVCNFIQPPSMFTDPDTGVARQMDLRKDEMGQQTQVGPDGQPLPGQEGMDPNDPTGQDPAMEGLPGQAGDQIADLFCPACGFSADTQEPMTNNDPAMPSEQQGLQEGDVCPNCGQATMLSPNDVGEMGGEVPQEIADDADADGMPDDQEPDVDEDGIPDDTEPDEDADGRPDDAENDEDQDEVPDDADPDDDGDGEADAVEDEDEAPKGRKDNARRV